MKNLSRQLVVIFSIMALSSFIQFINAEEAKEEIKQAAIEETVLGMNVSGNKEAPNILYIIPWKDSSDNATPPEVTRLMDEIYSTVDPDVYQKEVQFFDQLTGGAANTEIKNKE